MDINDEILADNPSQLVLLIDTSAYLDIRKLGQETSIDPFELLERYPNIDYFYSEGMVKELISGREGLNEITSAMLRKSLRDEGVSMDDSKDPRTLYDARDGSIRVATLTSISGTDHGQILLCQNHDRLVLVTNDHRMLKNAAAVLDNRLMDVRNLLEFMIETPDAVLQTSWQNLHDHHVDHSGYKRPTTVRTIPDRQPGEKPPHLRG